MTEERGWVCPTCRKRNLPRSVMCTGCFSLKPRGVPELSRDAKRIYPFISELMVFWLEHPEWRFGQLVMNLSREKDGFADIWEWDIEQFKERISNYGERMWHESRD